MKDAKTGLDLPAGTHLLDGGQALQYVRSRYVDGTSDLGGCSASSGSSPRWSTGRRATRRC